MSFYLLCKVIVYVIMAVIIYYVWWDDLKEIFFKIQCSRFSWPVGMINDIKPLPMCKSFSKTIIDKTNINMRDEGAQASGFIHALHSQRVADGPMNAETSNEVLIDELMRILNENVQITQQYSAGFQEINSPRITFPKNEKKAQRQVYIKDNVKETVQMGALPPDPALLCPNNDPIMKTRLGKDKDNNNWHSLSYDGDTQYLKITPPPASAISTHTVAPTIVSPAERNEPEAIGCKSEKYNILLPTGGIKKNVSKEQISLVYGCNPSIKQEQNIKVVQITFNSVVIFRSNISSTKCH